MDLTGWLRRHAAPHPLLVTARGGTSVRLAVERQARERGWPLAGAPAEADLLVVCGHPDPELRAEIERVWATLAAPRARAEIGDVTDVGTELERARAELADVERQRSDRATERLPPDGESAHDGPLTGDLAGNHGPENHDGHGYDNHEMRPRGDMPMISDAHEMHIGTGTDMASDGHQMDMGSGGHDMHMMHGGEVAGVPMADRGPDRDGLTLDQLHVVLGPVLPDWPTGLCLRATVQGDVVQSATVEAIGPAEPQGSPWDAAPRPAALDSLARLLSVCGWGDAARSARRLRDDLLAGTADEAQLRSFGRRLRRSRSLRWATDGVGRLDESFGELSGDATRRWRRRLDLVEHPGAPSPSRTQQARVALEVLPGLLDGQELAAVRVIVASLDPDLDALVAVHERVRST